MSTQWELAQKDKFQGFVREVIQSEKLDYIFLLERKGKLYEWLNLIPAEFEGYVGYDWCARLIPGKDLENKNIGIFDDVFRRGVQLSRFCKRVEKRTSGTARTVPVALIRVNGSSDLEADVTLRETVSGAEGNRIVASVTDYLLSKGVPLDIDHPMIQMRLRTDGARINASDFLAYLGTFGDIIHIAPLPSHRHITVTLDRPSFFRVSGDGNDLGIEEEGVVKIRFYINPEQGIWYVVPLVYPKASINIKERATSGSCKRQCRVPFCKVLTHYTVLENRTKVECCYRCITVNESLALALAFLKQLGFFVQASEGSFPELTVADRELRWFYGPEIGESIVNYLVSNAAKFSYADEGGVPTVAQQADLFSDSVRHETPRANRLSKQYIQEVLDVLLEFERSIPADDIERRLSSGLSFSEIKQANGSLTRREISESLDILLDLAVLKPLNTIRDENRIVLEDEEILEDRTYQCVRAYRVGEVRDEKTRTDLRTRSRAARLIPLLASEAMRRHKLPKGFASLPTNKTGCIFMKMWQAAGNQSSPDAGINLCPETRPWGPMLKCGELPSRPQIRGKSEVSVRGYDASLIELAREYQTFRIEFGNPSLVIPMSGWDVDLKDYFHDGTETYMMLWLYAEIVSELYRRNIEVVRDGKSHTYDILTTLSACTTEDEALLYWTTNLREWRKSYEGFLDIARRYAKSRAAGIETEELTKSLDSVLTRAAEMQHEMGDKITRYENLGKVKEKVEKIEWPSRAHRVEVERLLLPNLEVPPRCTERYSLFKSGHGAIRSLTHVSQNALSTLGIVPDRREDSSKKLGDYLDELRANVPKSALRRDEFISAVDKADLEHVANLLHDVYFSEVERKIVLPLEALGTLSETQSVKKVMEVVKELPPEDYEKRVFIGGNYEQMDDLAAMRETVTECGFVPVIADQFKVPRKEIHDYDMYILAMCRRAIFEVSSPGGQYMELEKALDYWKPEDILVTWQKRRPKDVEPPKHVSSMIKTKPFRKRGYLRPDEPLDKVIRDELEGWKL